MSSSNRVRLTDKEIRPLVPSLYPFERATTVEQAAKIISEFVRMPAQPVTMEHRILSHVMARLTRIGNYNDTPLDRAKRQALALEQAGCKVYRIRNSVRVRDSVWQARLKHLASLETPDDSE